MSFGNDLDKFREKTLEKYVKVLRLSSFDLFSAIVIETPVKKGVLRGNWYANIGSGSSYVSDTPDPGGQATIARIKTMLEGVDIARDIFFTNNLPYAQYIEFDGISGKAPEGMVRVNTIRWDQIVRVNVRRVNRGG